MYIVYIKKQKQMQRHHTKNGKKRNVKKCVQVRRNEEIIY